MSDTLAIINKTLTNPLGQPLAGLTIAILTGDLNGASQATVSTQPGSPLSTIYADPAGATQLTNPTPATITSTTATVTTDGNGNLCSLVNGVYTPGICTAKSGYYVLQAYGEGILGQILFQVNT